MKPRVSRESVSISCLKHDPTCQAAYTSLCWLCLSSSEDHEDEEEVVHMGNAIMSFYSALIDLLGRCAPEMHVSDEFAESRFEGLEPGTL